MRQVMVDKAKKRPGRLREGAYFSKGARPNVGLPSTDENVSVYSDFLTLPKHANVPVRLLCTRTRVLVARTVG